MMKDGKALSLVASHLLGGFLHRINWGDLWSRPISEGSAFEWTVLAALAAQARQVGWEVAFPTLELEGGASLFPLRNEIPQHHGAQPGHSGVGQSDLPLKDRFIQALVPKVVLGKGEVYYSVFREGCPYHKIMAGKDYSDRPDILLLAGRPTPGFPRLGRGGSEVDFSFDFPGGATVSGTLRVVNSRTIPCTKREPIGGIQVPAAGLVECSVNKTAHIAEAQLARYERLFSVPPYQTPQFLITGKKVIVSKWPCAVVDLSLVSREALEMELRAAADAVLAHFGLR